MTHSDRIKSGRIWILGAYLQTFDRGGNCMDKIQLVKAVSSRLSFALAGIITLLVTLFIGFMYVGTGLTLPVVMLLGALGAFISLQRRLKELADHDLMLMKDSVPYTLLAPLAGATLAGVLYLAFLSGIIAGELFPSFQITDRTGAFAGLFSANSSDPADYAKLLFWSFVAGFSERFVTNIIGKFETEVPGGQQGKPNGAT